ncbi:MAG: ferritin-like domain-containing protein, partial [Bacteroidota bacterium]
MASQNSAPGALAPLPPGVTPELAHNLRTAMSIELATLPTYLYTYWSIKSRKDGGSVAGEQAAKLILSVVTEEMLHFALVGNVMNALGIPTAINHPKYIPTFPGPLPGHSSTVNPFTVSLQPLNALAIQIFLDIEMPESDEPATDPPSTTNWSTIGEFYAALKLQLTPDLDYSHGRQLNTDNNPGPGVLVQ